ncbi:MAG: general secretion pathway protein GspB [Candidatus Omnitrophica bacterium]|nr:general secretion pathway protein GspB [Candidatus Omnitrophota bacterium]
MEKKRVELIVTVSLVLILIVSWVNTMKFMKRRSAANIALQQQIDKEKASEKKPKEVIVTKKPLPVEAMPDENVQKTPEMVQMESLGWARCPFGGKIYGTREGTQDLKVAGIIWDNDPVGRFCIINNSVVKVGEKAEGFTVVEIKENSVVLTDGKKNIELKLEK